MKHVTKFLLLYASALLSVLLGLTIALFPLDSVGKFLTYSSIFIAITVAAGLVEGPLKRKLKDDSKWLYPVSIKFGTILVNSVIVVWFCFIVIIGSVMLMDQTMIIKATFGTFLVVIGVAGGLLLRIYFPAKSSVPYAVSFFAALIVVITIVGVIKP